MRCAFWLVFRLLNAGDLPSASGWIARIERLLCDAADDSPEVPLAYCGVGPSVDVLALFG